MFCTWLWILVETVALLIHMLRTCIMRRKGRYYAKPIVYAQDEQPLLLALLNFYDPFLYL